MTFCGNLMVNNSKDEVENGGEIDLVNKKKQKKTTKKQSNPGAPCSFISLHPHLSILPS
jgi:hypothetical protein